MGKKAILYNAKILRDVETGEVFIQPDYGDEQVPLGGAGGGVILYGGNFESPNALYETEEDYWAKVNPISLEKLTVLLESGTPIRIKDFDLNAYVTPYHYGFDEGELGVKWAYYDWATNTIKGVQVVISEPNSEPK